MKKVFVAGAVLLSSSVLALAQAPTKIGIINIQAAIIGTREGQTAAKDLEAKAELEKAVDRKK